MSSVLARKCLLALELGPEVGLYLKPRPLFLITPLYHSGCGELDTLSPPCQAPTMTTLAAILDLDSIPSARGAKPKPLEISYVRDLNELDIPKLTAPDSLGDKPPTLKELRHSHHLLARSLAEGKAPAEAGAITGYSPSRISILQNDPAFAELIEYYKGQVEVKYVELHERVATLSKDAVEELLARLDDDPSKFSKKELMEITKLGTDVIPMKAKPSGPGGASGTAPLVQIVFKAGPGGSPELTDVTHSALPAD